MHGIWKRLATIFLTMVVVSALVFFALSLSSGDSSAYILAEDASAEQIEAYREAMGLTDPLLLRYLKFFVSFFTGDWGVSAGGVEIITLVKQRLPVTLSVSLLALAMALLIAVPLAYLTLGRKGVGSAAATGWATLMASSPVFLLSLVLVIIFSVSLGWFPVSGYAPLSEGLLRHLQSVFLPSLSLALLHSSFLMIIFRRALRENMEQPYALIAAAMGMSVRQRAFLSATKPALPVLVTLLGQSAASFLGGSAAVETVFAIPGIGSLVVSAALGRDARLSGVLLMLISCFVSVISFAAECIALHLDPRRRA